MACGSRSQSSSSGLSNSVEDGLAAADEALVRPVGVVDPAVEQVVRRDRVLVQPGDVVRLGEGVHHELPVHRPLVVAGVDVLVGGDVEVGDLVVGAVQRVLDGERGGRRVGDREDQPEALGDRHLDQAVGRLVDVVEAGLGARGTRLQARRRGRTSRRGTGSGSSAARRRTAQRAASSRGGGTR